MVRNETRYVAGLAALFGIEFVALAIAPSYRSDWLLENVLVFVFLGLLGLSFRAFRLSPLSYTLIFLFLGIHEVGAHYTYGSLRRLGRSSHRDFAQ